MKRLPDCAMKLGTLQTTQNHTVLCESSQSVSESSTDQKWHPDFVKLPYSPENVFPQANEKNVKVLHSQSERIKSSFTTEIKSAAELAEAILKYNPRYKTQWDFAALTTYFDKIIPQEDKHEIFEKTLPAIITLALDLPKICNKPIPLLKTNVEHSISLSQMQIASLLANAFLCTFPHRIGYGKHAEYSSYPRINFNELFCSQHNSEGNEKTKFEKYKCIFNYFKRVTSEKPTGVVTFQRKCVRSFPDWKNSEEPICDVDILSEGLIEDQDGMLQVDFANKRIGGGVLRRGCVQEEISFLLCPELIVSRLFTEILDKHEALLITGCERFNDSSGYSNTFRWTSDYKDKLPRDEWHRINRQIVAIDATRFPSTRSVFQYEPSTVIREVNKAFAGFSEPHVPQINHSAIVTGNWGCGAFHGDPRLKFLIQLMASSCSQRELIYYTFGDEDLGCSLREMYSFIKSKNFVVGDVMGLIEDFHESIAKGHNKKKFTPKITLFKFIYDRFKEAKAKVSKSTSNENQPVEFLDDSSDEVWVKNLYDSS